jgi:hypothetical protein
LGEQEFDSRQLPLEVADQGEVQFGLEPIILCILPSFVLAHAALNEFLIEAGSRFAERWGCGHAAISNPIARRMAGSMKATCGFFMRILLSRHV